MLLYLLLLLIPAAQASVTGALLASRLRALQHLQAGKLQALQSMSRQQPNASVVISSIRPAAASHRSVQKVSQGVPGKKPVAGRYYPEFGPLSVREVIAKETFRLIAQMALDRMPSKRHDSHEWYSPSHHYDKKKGHHHHLQGRQFFESEEFVLFLIGLGLASVLGMATMMAPLNQMMYSNSAFGGAAYGGGGFAGVPVGPAGPAILAAQHGRRRRRSLPRRGHRREVDIEAIVRQIERASRLYNAARSRSPRVLR